MTNLFEQDSYGWVDLQLVIVAPETVILEPGDTIRLESAVATTRIKIKQHMAVSKGEKLVLDVKGSLEMFVERKERT